MTNPIPKKPEQPDKPSYLGLTVLVECDGLRRLANQDESGKWRTISRKRELQGVVKVVKVLQGESPMMTISNFSPTRVLRFPK